MIKKIDTSQIQDLLEKSSSRQSSSKRAIPNDDVGNPDVSVHVNYASFIEKAMQTPKTDSRAVQRARELLLSGQLEYPENICEAAENIITFGI